MASPKRPRGRPPAPCDAISPTSKRCFDRANHPYPPYRCTCAGARPVASRPRGRPPAQCASFPADSARCRKRAAHPYAPYRCVCKQKTTMYSQFKSSTSARVRAVKELVAARPDKDTFWRSYPLYAARLQWLSNAPDRAAGLTDDQLINLLNRDGPVIERLKRNIERTSSTTPPRLGAERRRIRTNLNGEYWRA